MHRWCDVLTDLAHNRLPRGRGVRRFTASSATAYHQNSQRAHPHAGKLCIGINKAPIYLGLLLQSGSGL